MRRAFANSVRRLRTQILGAAITLLPLCHAGPVRAQIGASLSLDSDYRFRGVSLSQGQPTLSLDIAYDHPSGAYAGASAIAVRTTHSGAQLLGYTGYAGYAVRTPFGLAWDMGVSNTTVTEYVRHRYSYNYSELYVGVVTDNISAHVYYSPSYHGEDMGAVYADLDGAFKPVKHWRVFGHVGALSSLGGHGEQAGRRERYDLRAGVATEFEHGELRLAWTLASPQSPYPAERIRDRGAVVLGATYFF